DQQGPAGVGRGVRRRRGGRRHLGPAHAPGGGVQHPRPVVAHARARGAGGGGARVIVVVILVLVLTALAVVAVTSGPTLASAVGPPVTVVHAPPRRARARAPP